MRNSVDDNMSIREEDDQMHNDSMIADSIYSHGDKGTKVGTKTPTTN